MYLEVVAANEDVNHVVGLDAQRLSVVDGVAESSFEKYAFFTTFSFL